MTMTGKKQIVTLDGPSGVGKSTISRKIAASLGYTYLDTGAMYRAVAYHLRKFGVDIDDTEAVAVGLEGLTIALLPAESEEGETGVVVNDEDVSNKIRTPEMSMLASKVSAIAVVREKLTRMQRDIGLQGKIVAEGRDAGTVVFPDAAYKFYLDADVRERARRRIKQLGQEGGPEAEENMMKMIGQRDSNDSSRAIAPLKQADDAFFIDTTNITIDEVCRLILQRIEISTL